jgi:hypothetical protein
VSENLIHSVAPHLAPPVSRERIRSASEAAEGATLSYMGNGVGMGFLFADDDAE